jgi:hypothetical protein
MVEVTDGKRKALGDANALKGPEQRNPAEISRRLDMKIV